MTFRPSVLPDRDNDILSTFTRSFEQARSLVRQGQADQRAKTLFEQGQEDRRQDRESRMLDFNLRASETPGVRQVSGDVDPGQLRLQAALGGQAPMIQGPPTGPARGGRDVAATDMEGGGMIPAIPGRAIAQPRTASRMNIPRDVLDPSTPVLERDFVDQGVGPDGRRVTTSDTLRRGIERTNAVAADQDLPSEARDRRGNVGAAVRFANSGLLTNEDGSQMFTEQEIRNGDVDAETVIQAGREAQRNADIFDRTSAGVEGRETVAQIRARQAAERGSGSGDDGPSEATLNRVNGFFNGLLDDERGALEDAINPVDAADPDFVPPQVDDARKVELYQQAVRQAFASRQFGDPESPAAIAIRDQMLRDASTAVTGGGGPGARLSSQEVSDAVGRFQGRSAASVRTLLESIGTTPAQIEQILAALPGG